MPLGFHTVFDCVKTFIIFVCVSFLMRYAIDSIVPFEPLVDAVLVIILEKIVYDTKLISVKHKGRTRKWSIRTTGFSPSLEYIFPITNVHHHSYQM